METTINDWNQDVSLKIYHTNQLQNKNENQFHYNFRFLRKSYLRIRFLRDKINCFVTENLQSPLYDAFHELICWGRCLFVIAPF
jgi:hypothetical protein